MNFKLDHVHIVSKDVDEMSSFFQRLFLAEVLSYDENLKGAPNTVVEFGGLRVFIRGVRPGEAPDAFSPELVQGLDHFGLEVENVEESANVLRSRGANFLVEPEASGVGGRMIAFICGPENVRIELCQKK
ncbi:MAG: hypothetical protein CMH79_05010 [Nitrospinae bacterium]|nr:hypothetical protein [Nitrospinota bacterium]|tara:strand:- start:535 stop:924 length:390 start_codon:yes stop_codon:yes gene_type:complete